jgi:DNA/RNA-binding domain of Phe-tRNA-synthetase-like protein
MRITDAVHAKHTNNATSANAAMPASIYDSEELEGKRGLYCSRDCIAET